MLDSGNVSVDDLEKIFFDTDIDRAIFTYQNVLTKVGESDVVNSFNKYKAKYPNNGMDRELYNKYFLYNISKPNNQRNFVFIHFRLINLIKITLIIFNGK